MFRNTLIAAALSVAYGGLALAAVTAEEAKQLGTTLTPIGAEKAGNKDGTIPEWTGGLTTPPAGFVKGSGFRPDPFAADKPRLTIDAKNMAQHADKLTIGTQELLKRNPGTYRIDVYPTRRPVTYPKRIFDNAAKNAVNAKTGNGGLSIEGAIPGVPFPIAKTGNEAMWNHLVRFTGNTYCPKYDAWNVDSAGVPTLATVGESWQEYPIYLGNKTDPIKGTDIYFRIKLNYLGPARRNGEACIGPGLGQPARTTAPCVAVPAGPAPRQGRAGSRLRHAQPRYRRCLDLRRCIHVQRRDGPLRLQADRQEGDVRPVQLVQALLPAGHARRT